MNFPQFAFNNVKRNSRAYFAFFLSSAFMVMIFFSYSVFIYHPGVASIELGTNSAAGMKIASYIVFVFAFFFVLYSISAFLKLRNLEFGILMMLGARSGQINKLILIENMLIGLLSIVTGMSFGMLLSKLFLLLSTTIMGMDHLPFYWPVKPLLITSISFISLFLVISIFTLLFIRKHQVLDLLKGSVKPKKEPRVSWLLSLLGLLLLTAGALAIRKQLSPITLLVAAVTGIAGTYFFYSQLSVLGIRLLKLSRKRLWRGTNLLWISEMSYKIKDNARMLFLVTVVTSLACMASGFILSMNQANIELYKSSPFAMEYSIYKPGKTPPDLEPIHNKLQNAKVEYTENKIELISASIQSPGKEDTQSIDLISWSQFNQLASKMDMSEVAPLSDKEAVLLLNPQLNSQNYTTNQKILLKVQNDTELMLKEVQIPKSHPMGQYTSSLLIVDDSLYKNISSSAAKYTRSYVKYLYKIPAWDGPPPVETSPEAIITKELIQWSRDSNNTNNQYISILDARADNYLITKQGMAMLSFIGIFIALIFSLSSASFLFFKLHTELNADKQMYNALSKIGLSVKEMSASATRQISVLFYIPIIVATIQTLVVIRPVLKQISITNVTVPVLITSGAFLAVQTIYFIIARSRYIQSLKKMMV
ncbi:FtsX-like permease family protein [Paenibacillus sp. B2(2019)]|uniref:FtsX-like permease family protein n=1 Tax=Paenibacillus sp. B2(2019) TaxID=2607754 RepID=UPI0011F2D595|nr:ABC transporter permease [Paenibacillus sp. B2(2019)]KAA1183474.1 ABC transporter permease [Paenibacillus sp. B2(2019)]